MGQVILAPRAPTRFPPPVRASAPLAGFPALPGGLRMKSRQRLFLIGPMGAGKTTVGKRLATLRQLSFIDSDHEVEARTGADIPLIFEKEGEAGFRRREKQAIADLCRYDNVVLATGGGAVLDADSRRVLAEHGVVIYLQAGVDQQLHRTSRTDNRPLLKAATDRRAVLEEMARVREPLYREIADIVVHTDGRNARLLAQEIDARLESSCSAG